MGAAFGVHDAALAVVGAETALLTPLVYRDRPLPLGVLCAFDRLADDPGLR